MFTYLLHQNRINPLNTSTVNRIPDSEIPVSKQSYLQSIYSYTSTEKPINSYSQYSHHTSTDLSVSTLKKDSTSSFPQPLITPVPITTNPIPVPKPPSKTTPSPAFTPRSESNPSPAPTPPREPTPTPPGEQSSTPTREPNSGICEYPYNRERNNGRCGKRSADSKPGGSQAICYAQDTAKNNHI